MGLRIDRKQDKRVVHACTHNLADIPNGVTVCSADLVAGGVLQEGTVIGKDEAVKNRYGEKCYIKRYYIKEQKR